MSKTEQDEARRQSDSMLETLESALASSSIEELGKALLPTILRAWDSERGFLAVRDPRLTSPWLIVHGLTPETEHLVSTAEWPDTSEHDPGRWFPIAHDGVWFSICDLAVKGRHIGWIGIVCADSETPPGGEGDRLLESVAAAIDRLAEREALERRLLHLNTYLTVSTMLSKSVDLPELLEAALFCSMEAVSAEAASVLLLDDAGENFQFYRVEGPAKPLLGGASFPVREGVAGRVLKTLEAEIVNDAENDERFYDRIDHETGFRTRNLIAIALVAGEEPVGVLEVLNKVGGGPFTADERLILESVADEIAFAIRNATLFDYVINTYCKRRQGMSSCKGCERPLGSWTPCMRYREFLP